MEKLQAQKEYLEAEENGDLERMRQIAIKFGSALGKASREPPPPCERSPGGRVWLPAAPSLQAPDPTPSVPQMSRQPRLKPLSCTQAPAWWAARPGPGAVAWRTVTVSERP